MVLIRIRDVPVGDRYPHAPLRARAWELRRDVRFHGALYVALAELTGLSLVTTDAELAAAHGPRCEIEVV